MADYAGAAAAMRQRLTANFTAIPVAMQNMAPPANPWPPIDPATGNPAPWAFMEVLPTTSAAYATGVPGDQTYRYLGLIHVHVFVPVDAGSEIAEGYAVAAGEVFRNQKFYDNGAGDYVRTLAPDIDGGGSDADQGNTWRITMTVPFEYYHRG